MSNPASWRTPWRAVAAVFALQGALFGTWASRIPAFADRLDLSEGILGLILLAAAGGALASFPLAGGLSDRRGAARTARSFAVAHVLVTALLPFAPNAAFLALGLFAFGAAMGATDVAMNAWGAEVERAGGRPIMSSLHAMFSLGAGLGALSGFGAVKLGLSPWPHFWIACAGFGAAALWIARLPWTSRAAAGGPAFALPRGPLLLVSLFAFCSSLGEGAMADWSALFLERVKAATEAEAALGFAAFSVAMVATRLAGDRITVRFGPVATGRIAGLTSATGAMVAILAPGLWVALAGFALLGMGFATVVPLAFSRAANDPAIPPGQAIAATATLGYGGMLIGPPAIGFIAEMTSLSAAFGLIAAMSLGTALLAPALKRTG